MSSPATLEVLPAEEITKIMRKPVPIGQRTTELQKLALQKGAMQIDLVVINLGKEITYQEMIAPEGRS